MLVLSGKHRNKYGDRKSRDADPKKKVTFVRRTVCSSIRNIISINDPSFMDAS
jgi:hypothetical protein